VSAAEPRGEHRNPWSPRVGRESGKVGYVMLHDDLALAIIGARLASPKSLAVLLAIFWRHQRTYRGAEPVAVGRHELAEVIGCAPSSVQAALRELSDRDMIQVRPGGGRGHPSAYALTDPATWKLTGLPDTLERKVTDEPVSKSPETDRRSNSESPSPLRIPLRERTKKKRKRETEGEGLSRPEAEHVETVSTNTAGSSRGRAGDEGHAGRLDGESWSRFLFQVSMPGPGDRALAKILRDADLCRSSVEGDALILTFRQGTHREQAERSRALLWDAVRTATECQTVELRGAAS
jgi:hypothetical protein